MIKPIFQFAAAAVAALTLAGAAQAGTVFANGAAPGDTFTNAGGGNAGLAVGTSGWYYNNVRNSGTAGVNTTYARSGNGSAQLAGSVGPGGASSKADIEYLANGVNVGGNYFAGSSMGAFSAFTTMQYDWYRDSSSSNSAVQHPSLRILLDRDGNLTTIGDRGGLVFELVYNTGGAVQTDTWVTSVVTASTKLWNFGFGLGFEHDINGDGSPYDALADWQSSGLMANAVILGFSSGVGSGWGPFSGAVDNIGWTIGGLSQTTNFEVQGGTVPEPGSLAMIGLALAGLAVARRRRAA
jgi:hypothetical protein